MVGPRVYHIKHARSYAAFNANDPEKVMDLASHWLKRQSFKTKKKNKQYTRGNKKGIHVNFVPKFKLVIERGPNGNYIVRFDYYAKIKLGTAVVVGVLTSGISTVVGVGTLAVALSDADNFVDKFWKYIDSLAKSAPVILTVERWASDGKGGFVQQPGGIKAEETSTRTTTSVSKQNVPSTPPPPVPSAPPPPQPGEIYGHSNIQLPVQSNAPPSLPSYYPSLEKSSSMSKQPPQSPQYYQNYPPPPSSPHDYPPPSPHNYPPSQSQQGYPNQSSHEYHQSPYNPYQNQQNTQNYNPNYPPYPYRAAGPSA